MSVKIRPYRGSSEVFEVDITFKWPDGSQFRRRTRAPVKTRAQAQRWGEATERAAFALGKPQAPPTPAKEVPTLSEYVATYVAHARAEKQKASTIHGKEIVLAHHLVPVIGHKRLDEIGPAEVQRVKEATSQHSAKTINNLLGVLAHVFTVAIDAGVVTTRPKIKRLRYSPQEPPFYDYEDYARLRDGARRCSRSILIAVLLAGDAGLRRGEILALRWTDVNLQRKQLTVRANVWRDIEDTPKGGRGRHVPLTAALAAELQAHRHLRGPYILCGEDGARITPGEIQNWIERATARAGLTSTRSLHILRHTFCSHLAMRGAPVRAIQDLAGHASLSQTLRYMHLAAGATDAAIRLLDAARNGEGVEKARAARA